MELRLRVIYETTLPGSPLRKFAVEAYAAFRSPDQHDRDWSDVYPEEFQFDLFKALRPKAPGPSDRLQLSMKLLSIEEGETEKNDGEKKSNKGEMKSNNGEKKKTNDDAWGNIDSTGWGDFGTKYNGEDVADRVASSSRCLKNLDLSLADPPRRGGGRPNRRGGRGGGS